MPTNARSVALPSVQPDDPGIQEDHWLVEVVEAMAQIAYDVNRRTSNIGARRLYTILERVFETISFDAPELPEKTVRITGEYVRERLAEAVKDEDLSKFIL